MTGGETTPGERSRAIMREATRAALATQTADEDPPGPYASLVLVAMDHGGAPVLLLSDLADHTKNLRADARAALLFDGTAGYEDPLAGARVSVLGTVEPSDDPGLLARFVSRHPNAATYAEFSDFHLYRMAVERAHLVAGFGQIHWIPAGEVLFDARGAEALAAAEADIVRHMNDEHGDAVALIAREITGQDGADWIFAGIDPEGADLRSGPRMARVWFRQPIDTPRKARQELVRLTAEARARTASAGR